MGQDFRTAPANPVVASKNYVGGASDGLAPVSGADVAGGGWIVGVYVATGAGSDKTFTIYDGNSTSDPQIFFAGTGVETARTIEFPGANWRRFSDGAWIRTGDAVTLLKVFYKQ